MSTFIQQKQPAEVIPCIMDFVSVLPSGETISSSDVKIYDEDEIDQTADMIDGTPSVVGSQVRAKIEKGLDGGDYRVEFVVTTTPGVYVFEEEVYLKVREL